MTLLPVYTPTLTDEPNVSGDKVFFGGISVYLEQYVPLFRNSPRWLDRLWDSKAMLQLASRRSISTSPKMLGELTVSMLSGDAGFQQKEIAKLLDWLSTEGAPDIISLPYTLLLGLAKPIKETLKRQICCTLQGEDLFLEGLQEPYRSDSKELIRENIKYVDAFIAVSEYYAEFMPGYLGIPPEKIHVVPLGINLQGYSARGQRDEATAFHGRLFRARRSGKRASCFGGRLSADCGKTIGCLQRVSRSLVISPRSTRIILTEIMAQLKDAGLAAEFQLSWRIGSRTENRFSASTRCAFSSGDLR